MATDTRTLWTPRIFLVVEEGSPLHVCGFHATNLQLETEGPGKWGQLQRSSLSALTFLLPLGHLRRTDTQSCTFRRQTLQLHYRLLRTERCFPFSSGELPSLLPPACAGSGPQLPAPRHKVIYFTTGSSHLTTVSWMRVQDYKFPEDKSLILLHGELGHHQHPICVSKVE